MVHIIMFQNLNLNKKSLICLTAEIFALKATLVTLHNN